MEHLLSVSNLSVSFDDETVLEDINFELKAGENLAIVGPNGAGKTVLLKALLGMLRYKGEIDWAPNIRVGYIPQKIDAEKHLPLNLRNLLEAKAQILKEPALAIQHVIKAAEISKSFLETPIGHLSGGQFQRALIALALLGQPQVLILDEPTASIDERGEEQVYNLLHRLQDEYGVSLILVSHDLSVVYQYATHVLCINRTKVCLGPPHEALTPETLEKLYGARQKFFHTLHQHDK